MMQPRHEDCPAEQVVEKALCAQEPVLVTVICHHEHKDPTVIGEDLCSPETVGWHCHCCGRVWVDEAYVRGQQS